MKFTAHLLCTAWLFAPTEFGTQEIRFQPESGSELRKVFETRTAMEMSEFLMNGEPLPAEAGDFSMSIEESTEVTFVDRYVEVGEGRPLKLTRSFETLAQHSAIETTFPGQVSEEKDSSSDLEGETVVFDWDADEEQYSVYPDEDSDIDGGLLERLEEDTDLRSLLPEDDVEEGDGWELDAVALMKALDPGGDLGLDDDETEDDRELDDLLEENAGGEARATFVGTRDEGETQVAVIRFAGELESSADVTTQEGSERSIEMRLEVSGELLWDLGQGRMHSIEADSEVALIVVDSMESQGYEVEVSFSGSVRMQGATEAVE